MSSPPDLAPEPARGEIPRATRCDARPACVPRGRFVLGALGPSLIGHGEGWQVEDAIRKLLTLSRALRHFSYVRNYGWNWSVVKINQCMSASLLREKSVGGDGVPNPVQMDETKVARQT